jgi:RNA-directed DNA polymerase
MDKHVLSPTEEGAPQGGICSPVLANLTLDGLERVLREKYPKATALSRRVKVNLVRYADDFCVTGASYELLDQEVKPLIVHFLAERGLELSPEQTVIPSIEEGFDFLGQNVRASNGTILVKPSRKNVATFLTTVRTLIKANAQATAGHLIAQLNPVIRGWAAYHRHVSSKQTFVRVDHAIFCALWRWATRRHPKKPGHWVKDKYFRSDAGRHWVFQGAMDGRDGAPYTVRLFSAASMPIQRHAKIKGAANPYDHAWEVYFEARLGVTMEHTLVGKRKLLHLWKELGGICPVCAAKITKLSGWHTHHIVWRSHGGSESAPNLVLLHPTCHQQVHSQGLLVVKPRSPASV